MTLSPYQRRVMSELARFGAPARPTRDLMERTQMNAAHLQVHLNDLRRRGMLDGGHLTRSGRRELNR